MPSNNKMLPEFIVHRVGAFVTASDAAPFPPGDAPEDFSLRLAERMAAATEAQGSNYANAIAEFKLALSTLGSDVHGAGEVEKPDIVRVFGPEEDGDAQLVTRLPPLRFDVRSGDFQARVILRFTLTACALEHTGARTKVWATSEVLPLRGIDYYPLATVLAALDAGSDRSLPLFVKAVEEFVREQAGVAVGLSLSDERMRMTFADDFDPFVGAYLDAVVLDQLPPAKVGRADDESYRADIQRCGKVKFAEFVDDIENVAVDDAEVKVLPWSLTDTEIKKFPDLDQIAGVYVQRDRVEDGRRELHVTGITRRNGAGGLRNFPADEPDLAELMARGPSGARVVSAYLANHIAERFEDRIFAVRPKASGDKHEARARLANG